MSSLETITVKNAEKMIRLAQLPEQGYFTWSSDGQYLAVSSRHSVRVYAMESLGIRSQRTYFGTDSFIHSGLSTLTADFRLLAIYERADATIYIYDLDTNKTISILRGGQEHTATREIIFSPTGKYILSYDWNDASLIWDVEQEKVLFRFPDRLHSMRFAFSPDETRLVSAGDGTLCLWNLQTGTKQKILEYEMLDLWQLAFSPDGQSIAACGDSKALWAVLTSKRAFPSKAAINAYASVVNKRNPEELSSKLDHLNDKPVRIWNIQSGAETKLSGKCGTIASRVAFSPDGTMLVAGKGDGWSSYNPIQIWDFQASAELIALRDYEEHTAANGPICLAFSPDQLILAFDNGLASGIELWGIPK